ncbi:hypothetical protein [Roseospira visakhapatnamensis]|uniref:Putative DNA-binding protein (UPF0251 family) n=1 Tax=Roseospira visakhapatnamensis TaxID=390880 RepID=A0A7W6RFV1_9PROT|nr:hypothetical protein [Roseospira visakhapatnamensis]MBB4267804.1 putative DNA-binding protein (UPF0251 family) [Roseospira visakhapatnamensis]
MTTRRGSLATVRLVEDGASACATYCQMSLRARHMSPTAAMRALADLMDLVVWAHAWREATTHRAGMADILTAARDRLVAALDDGTALWVGGAPVERGWLETATEADLIARFAAGAPGDRRAVA